MNRRGDKIIKKNINRAKVKKKKKDRQTDGEESFKGHFPKVNRESESNVGCPL